MEAMVRSVSSQALRKINDKCSQGQWPSLSRTMWYYLKESSQINIILNARHHPKSFWKGKIFNYCSLVSVSFNYCSPASVFFSLKGKHAHRPIWINSERHLKSKKWTPARKAGRQTAPTSNGSLRHSPPNFLLQLITLFKPPTTIGIPWEVRGYSAREEGRLTTDF